MAVAPALASAVSRALRQAGRARQMGGCVGAMPAYSLGTGVLEVLPSIFNIL